MAAWIRASPALQKVQICIAVRNVRVSRGAGHVEKHPTGWCGRVDCLLVASKVRSVSIRSARRGAIGAQRPE
jgi:hypothetical protein